MGAKARRRHAGKRQASNLERGPRGGEFGQDNSAEQRQPAVQFPAVEFLAVDFVAQHDDDDRSDRLIVVKHRAHDVVPRTGVEVAPILLGQGLFSRSRVQDDGVEVGCSRLKV